MRKLLLVVLLVIVVCVAAVFLLCRKPQVELNAPPGVIGDRTPVTVHIAGPHGYREVAVTAEQDGKKQTAVVAQQKAHRLGIFKSAPASDVTFFIGRQLFPALHDGHAIVDVSAKANDILARSASASFDVNVVTQPPHVVADGNEHIIFEGGSELVVFTPTGYVTDSGVQAGKYRFRSFPVPTDAHERFSLFALPWDEAANSPIVVYASNPTGTAAKASFRMIVKPKKFRQRDIEITDAFLDKVENDIDPNGKGTPLERFLSINRELRKKNNQQISDMRNETVPRWLWSKPFFAIFGARESQFADDRSYIYHGKKVDEQVHLGFDIAGTQHMPIPAANDGKVIWADRLGIYGNCIVIDHGYGLQTIYGHMSEFSVKRGDMVKREQIIGHSGQTGLAGGDHLHFSMQVDGVQVNPNEWWDEHWIHDRIWSKVPPPSARAAQ